MSVSGFSSFRADIQHLPEMMSFILQCATSCKVKDDRLKGIELASEEALVNIIKYAYEDNKSGEIFIKCLSDDEGFHIQVIDFGKPFNPFDMKDPDISKSIEDRQIGGLGIFFIKQFMDTYSYKRQKDYNILTMSVIKKPS